MELNDRELLFRQYEFFVQSAHQISERRYKTNQFYISLLSTLLAILAFAFGKDNFQNLIEYRSTVLLTVSVLGILLNVIWFFTIRSFRKLNDAKFKVIEGMESLLPSQPYREEWKYINDNGYFLISKIEQWLCLTLTVPFGILIYLAY
jgi:HAMP domain-containing protein